VAERESEEEMMPNPLLIPVVDMLAPLSGLVVIANDALFTVKRTFRFKNPWYIRIFKGKYRFITGTRLRRGGYIINGTTLVTTSKAYEALKRLPTGINHMTMRQVASLAQYGAEGSQRER
jgi:hypothetical protein